MNAAFSFLDFYKDPLLFTSTFGSMLMCLASSLTGVIVFIRRRSLIGEALSHAAYPGVVLSILFASYFFPYSEIVIAFAVLLGAFISVFLGLLFMRFMEKRLKVKSDAALCFVLSSFLGMGILIASRMQITHALWYRHIQAFLYGQAATMTNSHVCIYGVLALLVTFFFLFLYHPIKVVNFDSSFSQSIGIKNKLIDGCCFILLILAIVIGIRSVGVVLMSGMLIAPAVTARQFTHRLSVMFVLSGLVGVFSGFMGNYLSITLPSLFFPQEGRFSLPTGPMILLFACTLCILSLLFGSSRGILWRFFKVFLFKYNCLLENLLKAMWKTKKTPFFLSEIRCNCGIYSWMSSFLYLHLFVWKYIKGNTREGFVLSEKGKKRAFYLVRHHRLWEVYLDELGIPPQDLHRFAEEMEHVISRDMGRTLTDVLSDPDYDPHKQKIPREEM